MGDKGSRINSKGGDLIRKIRGSMETTKTATLIFTDLISIWSKNTPAKSTKTPITGIVYLKIGVGFLRSEKSELKWLLMARALIKEKERVETRIIIIWGFSCGLKLIPK